MAIPYFGAAVPFASQFPLNSAQASDYSSENENPCFTFMHFCNVLRSEVD